VGLRPVVRPIEVVDGIGLGALRIDFRTESPDLLDRKERGLVVRGN
jgi:hypothetical protein